jgi:hypothetical protein
MTTLEKIIDILDKNGNSRKVTSATALTRGEFAVILSEWTYVTPEPGSEPFADTADYWGNGQVNALKRRGVLYETGNKFYPDKNIRKDDAAVILERVLVLPDTIDFHAIKFKDVPLSSYSYNAVSKLCYFDIMCGINKNFFKPENPVTAAELATMFNIIDKHNYPLNPDQHMRTKTKTRSYKPPNPDNEPVIEPK